MTLSKKYDLAIIGSGPGGYIAALYASRHNLKTCVIEKDLLGGTCLNKGCIPTKTLINSASIVSAIKDSAAFGVNVDSCKIDFPKMISRKNEVVLRLRTGVETLFRARKIDLVHGRASIVRPNTLDVEGAGELSAKSIIVASGSRPAELANIKIDERDILSSEGALNLKSLPKNIVVIGGGVIGCEFASLFNTLGSKVTIVEFMDRLIPTQSREASKKLEMVFKKRGIEINVSSKAESVLREGNIKISITGGKVIETEKVLVSVGRVSNIEGLGLEKAGVNTENGMIAVDEHLATHAKDIYAIGDCVSGPQLAHKASYDGIAACDNILGGERHVDYSNIPNCIWTDPEIASVGMNEEDARMKHPDARIAKFPYIASGKAYLEGKTEGFAKIIGDSGGKILGVEIFGRLACELIGEAVLARTSGITIEEWARAVHGHPTLSEITQEALHVFNGKAIHSI